MAKATESVTAKATEPVNPVDHSKDIVEHEFFEGTGDYAEDITAVFNGRAYKIKRGERVKLPRGVFDVIRNSMEQDRKTERLIKNASKVPANYDG